MNELTVKENTSKKEEGKMTLTEYQQKYCRPVNEKLAKTFLFVFAASIGVVIFFCLFLVVTKIWDYNQYAGYGATAVALIVYIFIYIVPLIKISQTKAFITNVSSLTAKEAKKHNKQMREDIADKMIDLRAKTTGVTWYSDEKVGKLAIARQTKDDKELKNVLTDIYEHDVRQAANKMIRDHAFKVGLTTALSQSEKIDTLFVCAYDLSMIKDIIYLYGFRPSDTKLMKIYETVIMEALVSYGIGNASTSITAGVAKKVGSAMTGIPVLGSVVETLIDSVSQGIINSSLTVVIGFQTKKYLMQEYHLQDILDDIELSEEEELKEEAELMNSLKEDITKTAKAKK